MPAHSHVFEVTTEGNLKCVCGESVDEPYIAFLDDSYTKMFHLLSEIPSDEYGLTSSGSEIRYSNNEERRNVVIKTCLGQSLVINAPQDNVSHYGEADSVTVESVADDSYYGKASVSEKVVIKRGHVTLEKNVSEVIVALSESSEPVRLTIGSGVSVETILVNERPGEDVKIEGNEGSSVGSITTDSPVEVSVSTDQIQIRSENASLILSGDAQINSVVVDKNIDFSGSGLSITVKDSALMTGLFGIPEENVNMDYQNPCEPIHIHNWIAVAASENSYIYECSSCHKQSEANVVIHNYGEWIIDSEATCTTPGLRHRFCLDEDCPLKMGNNPYFFEEEILSLDHDISTSWTTNSTKHYKVCKRCGEHIDEHSHNYPIYFSAGNIANSVVITAGGFCETCNYFNPNSFSQPSSGLFFTPISYNGVTASKSGSNYIVSVSDSIKNQYSSCKWYNSDCSEVLAGTSTDFQPLTLTISTGAHISTLRIYCMYYDSEGKLVNGGYVDIIR